MYCYLGLGLLVLISFFAVLVTRIFFGSTIAKRVHERVLGKGLIDWMSALGFWSLEIVGEMPYNYRSKSYVFVANHASWLDSAVMACIPATKKYLTNAKYFAYPVFGWTQLLAEDIPVNLSSKANRERSMQLCVQTLKDGQSIVIYPEGTRESEPPKLLPFKSGAFRIAEAAKVEVLPLYFENSHVAFSRSGWIGITNLRVIIGKPLIVENPADTSERVKLFFEECRSKMKTD